MRNCEQNALEAVIKRLFSDATNLLSSKLVQSLLLLCLFFTFDSFWLAVDQVQSHSAIFTAKYHVCRTRNSYGRNGEAVNNFDGSVTLFFCRSDGLAIPDSQKDINSEHRLLGALRCNLGSTRVLQPNVQSKFHRLKFLQGKYRSLRNFLIQASTSLTSLFQLLS